MSLKGMANHLAESCRYKEEGRFMPSGGGGGGGACKTQVINIR